MRFQKFQAVGNDFIIVREGDLPREDGDPAGLARRVCERHLGPGADGLEVILTTPSEPAADFAIRLFNADGGETPISGNGTRCVAAYLYFNDLWREPSIRIQTGAGIKSLTIRERSAMRFVFESDMGMPHLASTEVPVDLEEPLANVVRQKLRVGPDDIEFTACSMGNPHCSIQVESFDDLDWQGLGSRIERHAAFPERTNVEFIRVHDRQCIEVRFWERGVGPTLSSGTGSCAAVVACILNGLTERRVRVQTSGGELLVEWLADGRVIQTGEVSAVYRGELVLA